MEIETALTKTQLRKLNWLIYLRSGWFYFAVVFSLIMVIWGVLTNSWTPIFGGLGYAVFMIVYMTLIISRWASSKNNRNFFLKKSLTFNDDNVIVKTPISEGVVKWEAFIKWKKVKGYYLLYESKITFVVIPESDIPADKIMAFEKLLKTKITKK